VLVLLTGLSNLISSMNLQLGLSTHCALSRRLPNRSVLDSKTLEQRRR
jgi:hypothetical protein